MQIQTVFKAGNSNVVAIPKHLTKELELKPGQKVMVEKTADDAIIIKKVKSAKKEKKSGKINREFKKWLNQVLKEDAEILDELAVR